MFEIFDAYHNVFSVLLKGLLIVGALTILAWILGRVMWAPRHVVALWFTRITLWSLAAGALLFQSVAFWAELRSDRLADDWPIWVFFPGPWLALLIAPIAIPAAVVTVKLLRRRLQRSETIILTAALIAAIGAFLEFTATPLMILWSIDAEGGYPVWQPLLLIATNGFLQGSVISMLMVARADRADSERRQI